MLPSEGAEHGVSSELLMGNPSGLPFSSPRCVPIAGVCLW
jgi:hypothetical protein